MVEVTWHKREDFEYSQVLPRNEELFFVGKIKNNIFYLKDRIKVFVGVTDADGNYSDIFPDEIPENPYVSAQIISNNPHDLTRIIDVSKNGFTVNVYHLERVAMTNILSSNIVGVEGVIVMVLVIYE